MPLLQIVQHMESGRAGTQMLHYKIHWRFPTLVIMWKDIAEGDWCQVTPSNHVQICLVFHITGILITFDIQLILHFI